MRYALGIALGLAAGGDVARADEPWIWEQVWDELMTKPHDSEWRNLVSGVSGRIGYSRPLRQIEVSNDSGSGAEGQRLRNATVSLSISYNPASYFFANLTAFRYINSDLQRPWNPDFTYVFGYNDWHPYTFSFVYSNYGGNRWAPDRSKGEHRSHFLQGAFGIGYKFPLPDVLAKPLLVDDSASIGCNVGLSLVPQYTDLATLSTKTWKRTFSFSVKYNIYSWFYANASVFFYPWPEEKQPWNPDYTYGFGYFDWHPGTITVAYNNFGGNRFPWSDEKGASFEDGSIAISWSWSW